MGFLELPKRWLKKINHKKKDVKGEVGQNTC